MDSSDHARAVPVAQLRNLGPTTARWLAEVGVETSEQLDALGPVATYVRVRRHRGRGVSVVLLWALVGADLDLDWRDLPPQVRASAAEEAAALLGG